MAEQNDEADGSFAGLTQGLARALLVFAAINLFTGRNARTSTREIGGKTGSDTSQFDTQPRISWHVWQGNEALALRVYLSPSPTLRFYNESELLWSEDALRNDFSKTNAREHHFVLSRFHSIIGRAWRNESVYAHIVVALAPWNASSRPVDRHRVATATAELTKYLEVKKTVAQRSLLGGKVESAIPTALEARDNGHMEKLSQSIVAHWKPTLRVRLVALPKQISPGTIPQAIAQHIQFDSTDAYYYPVVYADEFWLTRNDYIAINDTVENLSLIASYDTIGFFKWQMQQSLEHQWETQRKMGLAKDGETDIIREVLATTQPWLLVVTAIVSTLHMIFEILTVRSNVKFWRNKKDLVGISARAIVINCFVQLIILLYLFDNETSWMVVISNCIGLATECWKLTKAVRLVREEMTGRWRIKIEENFAKSPTAEYDKVATSHLTFAIVPLMLGFAAYSLVTSTHKGWYSFFVKTGVSFV